MLMWLGNVQQVCLSLHDATQQAASESAKMKPKLMEL